MTVSTNYNINKQKRSIKEQYKAGKRQFSEIKKINNSCLYILFVNNNHKTKSSLNKYFLILMVILIL